MDDTAMNVTSAMNATGAINATGATWIGIEEAVYYLPGEAVCVSHWMESLALPAETRQRVLDGGHERHHPDTGLSVAELCAGAVGRLLARAALPPGEVDLLIHAYTLSTSVAAPPLSMVAALARDHGMHRADAFSVSNLHCGSMIGALRIIRNLMAVNPRLRNVVVVTADTERGPELRHQNQAYAPSDGAAAIWVKRDCRRNRVAGIAIDIVADLHMGYSINPAQRRWLEMHSQINTLRVIKAAIKRSSLAPADIVKLVPYNVSKAGWQVVGKRFSADPHFVFDSNIAARGHAYCSDIIINLVDGGFLDRRGGDAIVAAVRGAVGVYAAFVLQAAP